jgi:hypothetical protein
MLLWILSLFTTILTYPVWILDIRADPLMCCRSVGFRTQGQVNSGGMEWDMTRDTGRTQDSIYDFLVVGFQKIIRGMTTSR